MPESNFNLDEFRQRPDPLIAQLYRDHRDGFVRWAKGWSSISDEDTLADVFQDAIIILWNNVRTQRLTQLTASIKTYLYGIGRNLLRERTRRQPPLSLPDNAALPDNFGGLSLSAEDELVQQEERQYLGKALDQLGDPCRGILKLSYYEGLKSEQIAQEMGYSGPDVVRTQRKRCMDKLRDLLKR